MLACRGGDGANTSRRGAAGGGVRAGSDLAGVRSPWQWAAHRNEETTAPRHTSSYPPTHTHKKGGKFTRGGRSAGNRAPATHPHPYTHTTHPTHKRRRANGATLVGGKTRAPACPTAVGHAAGLKQTRQQVCTPALPTTTAKRSPPTSATQKRPHPSKNQGSPLPRGRDRPNARTVQLAQGQARTARPLPNRPAHAVPAVSRPPQPRSPSNASPIGRLPTAPCPWTWTRR